MPETSIILGTWLAVALTLFIFSFLYRENPLFRVAEHLFIGVTLGYTVIIVVYSTVIPVIYKPLMKGEFLLIFPLLLGACILTRFFPKYSWLSRFSFAFLMGYGSGLTIPTAIVTNFLKQLENTVQPLLTSTASGAVDLSWLGLGHGFSLLLTVVGVLSVLIYFYFSIEHKGVIQKVSKVGLYFIMIYLGAAFGTTVMGRFSLLYGRLFDLYTFRTVEYYYATPLLIILVVIFLIVYGMKYKEEKSQ